MKKQSGINIIAKSLRTAEHEIAKLQSNRFRKFFGSGESEIYLTGLCDAYKKALRVLDGIKP